MKERIFEMRLAGQTLATIANETGVSYPQVQKICTVIKQPERQCAYPPCGKLFTPFRAGNHYCCRGHRVEHQRQNKPGVGAAAQN